MADRVDDEPSAASEAIRLAEISARLATREHTLPQGKLSDLYQPLDKSRNEIRILRLLPYGYPDGMIHCHLETRSLQDDQLLYNAVSYAWGDATETAELCCNLAIVRVTKGLHSALKNLRSLLNTVEEELHLWIDGLCINQEDPDERSSQVLIMHIIYHQAANTIVWLGEEADDSAWAMVVAKRMGESKTLDATKPETWAEFPELYDNKFWTAVHHLFNRPFWTRLWVLQEI
ncbi:HET-domain-containing protein, partial [Thozetella sp. PMI_491]